MYLNRRCKCGNLMPHSYLMCDQCKSALWKKEEVQPQKRRCALCGLIVSSNRKFCDDCRAKRKKLAQLNKALNRLEIYVRGDTDIDIRKVYSRDKGICWICGCRCDWGDFNLRTYGNKYPTVDHVKPLSKGGLHVWDNVRLACHRCNSIKGAKENMADYDDLKAN